MTETTYRRQPNRAAGEPAASSGAIALPRVTWEGLAYSAIILAALAVRLAALGRWPLLREEANTALAAWRALAGEEGPMVPYVPLLYGANLFFFSLTRASDFVVRLLPALAGTALVAVPVILRPILGRRGALGASLILALAPTWVFFSRTADGAILAALAAAMLLAAAIRYPLGERPVWLYVGLAALAVGLTGGVGIYTALSAALVYALVWWLRHHNHEAEVASVREGLRRYADEVLARRRLLFFGGLVVALATALAVNLGGLGMTLNLAGAWFAALAPASTTLPWHALPRTLALYEFLTVALALVAAVRGLVRGDDLDLFFIVWALWALLLGTALGHRLPLWLPSVALPLVFLAARGIEYLWARLVPEAGWFEVMGLWITLPLLAFAFLQIASYLYTGQEQFLTYARLSVGILLIALAAYWFWSDRDVVARVVVAVLVLVLGVATVRISTAVAYQTGRDPREPLLHTPTSTGLKLLDEFATRVSMRQIGDPHLLDIAYEEELDPWMGWYLRDLGALAVPSIEVQPETTAMVSRALSEGQEPQGYAGQRFRLKEQFMPQSVTPTEWWRWFIYRDPVGFETTTDIQVWVKIDDTN